MPAGHPTHKYKKSILCGVCVKWVGVNLPHKKLLEIGDNIQKNEDGSEWRICKKCRKLALKRDDYA